MAIHTVLYKKLLVFSSERHQLRSLLISKILSNTLLQDGSIMGILFLVLSIVYVIGILVVLLMLNWSTTLYLIPAIDVHLWWAIIVFSITPIASFFLKRYIRKKMRKESWHIKGTIPWIVFGVCVSTWLLGLFVCQWIEVPEITTVLTTQSVLVIGTHSFLMFLFYRLSQRIK